LAGRNRRLFGGSLGQTLKRFISHVDAIMFHVGITTFEYRRLFGGWVGGYFGVVACEDYYQSDLSLEEFDIKCPVVRESHSRRLKTVKKVPNHDRFPP